MGKFRQDASELLKEVGGKENIQAVTHCVTRMRFVLVDPDKADAVSYTHLDVYKRQMMDIMF